MSSEVRGSSTSVSELREQELIDLDGNFLSLFFARQCDYSDVSGFVIWDDIGHLFFPEWDR
jgi:hypothetical protein